MSKPKLIYATDFYCVWCYAFSPVVQKIAKHFGDDLDIQIIVGDMLSKPTPITDLFSGAGDPMEVHSRITAVTGESFGNAYLSKIKIMKREPWKIESAVPAKAMLAMRRIKPGWDFIIHERILSAYYQLGKNISHIETYEFITDGLSIDFKDFTAALDSPEIESDFRLGREHLEGKSIHDFPTLAVEFEHGRTIPLSIGFNLFLKVSSGLRDLLRVSGRPANVTSTSHCLDGPKSRA
ncbi:hypothetical protein C7H84_06510 [Burkholderia sp. Nafp2/4-1b]|uniref:hypothetical protein n=1 Tax=Burkholderia sp. Nafp2/4-1b TaxID=2116686 RepID=UPI000EF8D3FE|nr:hypothetical protein [Burkholderia sp. Nafp2/4-1b]RKU04278.1 hypothetical protein C7H84_06510 [Burkholderia sp. Nafp2/4-1b]